MMHSERRPPISETNWNSFGQDERAEFIDVEGVIFVEPIRLTPVNQTSGLSILVHLVDHTELVSRIEAALDSLSI